MTFQTPAEIQEEIEADVEFEKSYRQTVEEEGWDWDIDDFND